MTKSKTEKLGRSVVLAFMALVTAYSLGMAFSQPEGGMAVLPEVAVYALAAGFGLEFLRSAWISG